ncbi:MAG: sigma-54-dependent transcriptional regulator [Magnetospiraceae bacterium]
MAYEILIVDDEAGIRTLTAGILQDEGYETREAATSDEAIGEVESRRPNLVLLDIWLQGSKLDGLGILREIKKSHTDLPVVMMSGHGTIETAVEAIRLGAYDFIEKPFKTDRLLMVVNRAIEAEMLRRENRELRLRSGAADDMIGNSGALNQLRQSIDKVAPTNSRVMITGAAGAGKEVAARCLHARSRRKDGPFIVVNCATMEPSQAEQQLFGAENDDDGIRVGMFEQAHGGTLFLDEVGDMPVETQGKIVRVLQEQTFLRVGGKRQVNVDVRVIASTRRDIREEIASGKFREDLFYRLSVVPLQIPALSQRREDIPQLTRYFMGRVSESLGQPVRNFSEDALAVLQAHDWMGNVRELRNVVERVIIMTPGEPGSSVTADMLPSELWGQAPDALRLDHSSQIMSLPIRDAREIFEKEYLTAQMTRFDGNISRTATFVGMERSALHRKLKALGLTSDEKTKV